MNVECFSAFIINSCLDDQKYNNESTVNKQFVNELKKMKNLEFTHIRHKTPLNDLKSNLK